MHKSQNTIQDKKKTTINPEYLKTPFSKKKEKKH